VKENSRDGSFAVYERSETIAVRLGTISFLPNSGLFGGNLTSTRKNALQKFLTEPMKGHMILLEELRNVEMPYR